MLRSAVDTPPKFLADTRSTRRLSSPRVLRNDVPKSYFAGYFCSTSLRYKDVIPAEAKDRTERNRTLCSFSFYRSPVFNLCVITLCRAYGIKVGRIRSPYLASSGIRTSNDIVSARSQISVNDNRAEEGIRNGKEALGCLSKVKRFDIRGIKKYISLGMHIHHIIYPRAYPCVSYF